MKAVLKSAVIDWTNKNLPALKEGTIITVRRLPDYKKDTIHADYIGTAVVRGRSYVFPIDKLEFDPIN